MFTRSIRSSDPTRTSLWRSRWAAIGAAVAVSLGAGGLMVAQAAPGPSESTIVSVTPERILDTRDPNNLGLAGPFVSPVSQKLKVTGSIPTATGTKTVVPAGATGVLLNVTAVGANANGFISIRPGDATGTPTTSSLNFDAGSVVPNSVQVSMPTAGANAGQIDITFDAYGQAGRTTDILIDVVGYTTNIGLQQLVADVATKVTGGAVVTSIGPGSWTTPSLSTLDQTSGGATMSGDGFGYLALTGPETRGGIAYTLKDVTYCVRSVSGGGMIDVAVIVGFNGTSGPETADGTNRTAAGCYTMTPSTATRAGRGFMVYLGVTGGAAARVTISNVTATWDARTTLGALEAPLESGGPRVDEG